MLGAVAEALVSDPSTSDGLQHMQQALKRADEYLGRQGRETNERIIHNRTVINMGGAANSTSDDSGQTGD